MDARPLYVSPLLQKGTVRVGGAEIDPVLPPGCVGIMFVYDNREDAVRESGGREPLALVERVPEPKPKRVRVVRRKERA